MQAFFPSVSFSFSHHHCQFFRHSSCTLKIIIIAIEKWHLSRVIFLMSKVINITVLMLASISLERISLIHILVLRHRLLAWLTVTLY